MGTRHSVEETAASKRIDDQLRKDFQLEKSSIKLLLLGPGECGKSTVLKQMRILHGMGFTHDEYESLKATMQYNTLQDLLTILENMETLKISFADVRRKDDLTELQCPVTGTLPANAVNGTILQAMKNLWADAGVQKCFAQSNLYQVSDSAKYFLDAIERIFSADYFPTQEDVLRMRVRTTGIVEVNFKLRGLDFRVFDVGGQRTERKKWIHCFDNVTAILFIVAMSEYDQVLFEDNKTNRMLESMHLFESICNTSWFSNTTFILFLNKKDLFEKKLSQSPLKSFFPDYNGSSTYKDASEFVREKFLQLNHSPERSVFSHFTCATDTDQISFVLDACVDTIISNRLKNLGLT